MFGLALPATHPVWTAVEEPLPIEVADTHRVIAAPGWLASGTKADGIVRLVNHGTDHASLGDQLADSPIYARLGYSSATIPPLTGATLDSPVDSSVSVLDATGRASHRTGFAPVGVTDDGGVLRGVSVGEAHWVDTSGAVAYDHGSGRAGIVTDGPRVEIASLLHGAWEVRFARVLDDTDAAVRLRFSGWPLDAASADAFESVVAARAASIVAGRLTSRVIALNGVSDVRPSIHTATNVSPLAAATAVPWLDVRLAPGATAVVAVCLTGETAVESAPTLEQADGEVVVTWGDAVQWRGDPLRVE